MTRPMCRLCGMEFPLPIQLDEVPEAPRGEERSYFVCQIPSLSNPGKTAVDDYVDRNRGRTRVDVETRRAQWTREAAYEQHLALQKAMRVFKKKNRVLDVAAVLKHCVENANGTTDVQTDGGDVPQAVDA